MADEHTMGVEPIVVRHSELADFRQCPLKHRWSWHQGWHNPNRGAGGPLELGVIWHEIMKARYRYIQKCQESAVSPDEDEIEETVGRLIQSAHSELREILRWMYDGYIKHWGWDPDLQIVSVEQTLRVPFHDENDQPLVIRGRPVLYSWTTDVLARSRVYRALMVVDHKSTSSPLGRVDIDLSDQFGLYTVAWRRLGENVRGQLVNQVHTKPLKRPMTMEERFKRMPAVRTQLALRSIELDAVRTIRAMWSEENLAAPYSAPDPRTCSWKCDFKEVHLKMRGMRSQDSEARVLRAFGMEQGATHGQ